MLTTIVTILILLICLFLALIVLVQNPKGGGLVSGFSSASQIGGVRKTTDFLEKATWVLVISLVVFSIFSAGLNPRKTPVVEQVESVIDQVDAPITAPNLGLNPNLATEATRSEEAPTE